MNENTYGNKYWRASDYYREVMLEYATKANRVLECGSGLTSIELARADVHGVALEHTPEWAGYAKGFAQAMGVKFLNFQILNVHLKDYGMYEWYDYQPKGLFDFIACDGPPRHIKGNRYGLLPTMQGSLAPGALILYDDYTNQEQSATDNWKKLHNVSLEKVYTQEDSSQFALLKVN